MLLASGPADRSGATAGELLCAGGTQGTPAEKPLLGPLRTPAQRAYLDTTRPRLRNRRKKLAGEELLAGAIAPQGDCLAS
jgi:hypothetical protein